MLVQKCSCTHHSPGALSSLHFSQRQQLKLAQTSGREDFKRTTHSLCISLFKKRHLHSSVILTARGPQIYHCDIIYEQSEPYQTTLYFAKLPMVTDSSQGAAQVSNFYSCDQWILAGAERKGPLSETEFSGVKQGSKFSLRSGVCGSDPVAHIVHVKIFSDSS